MEAAEPAASPTGATTTGPKGIADATRLTPIAVAGRSTPVVTAAAWLQPAGRPIPPRSPPPAPRSWHRATRIRPDLVMRRVSWAAASVRA